MSQISYGPANIFFFRRFLLTRLTDFIGKKLKRFLLFVLMLSIQNYFPFNDHNENNSNNRPGKVKIIKSPCIYVTTFFFNITCSWWLEISEAIILWSGCSVNGKILTTQRLYLKDFRLWRSPRQIWRMSSHTLLGKQNKLIISFLLRYFWIII